MQQKKLFGEAGFEYDGSVNFPENIERMIDSAIINLQKLEHKAELSCCYKLKRVIDEYKAEAKASAANNQKSKNKTQVAGPKQAKQTTTPQKTKQPERAQNIISNENKNVAEPNPESKIGEFVRNAVEYLISKNFLDEAILKDITSAQWSRDILHLNHPFFREIDDKESLAEQRKDNYGRARYWDIVFVVGSKKYVVCKEWYERQRKHFVPWYEKVIRNAKSEAVYKKNRPIGLRNLF